MTFAELCSDSREPRIVRCREEIAYRLYHETQPIGWIEVGHMMGRRNHIGVHEAARRYAARMQEYMA